MRVIVAVVVLVLVGVVGVVALRWYGRRQELKRHEKIMAEMDFSTVVGAGKALCAAFNDGGDDAIDAALGGDYFVRSQKNCNKVERLQNCGRAKGYRDIVAMQMALNDEKCKALPLEYEKCRPQEKRENLKKFLKAVRDSNSTCKAIFKEENPANEMTVMSYGGVTEQVEFEQGSSGWRPSMTTGNPLMQAQRKMHVDDINNNP